MKDLRSDALGILHQALAGVDPAQLVNRHIRLDGDRLHLADVDINLRTVRKLVVVGTGKGAAPMAQAAEEILGDRIADGAITVKYGHGLPLKRIRVYEAGHPVLDQATLAGTREIMKLLQVLQERDLALVLISGGGSALLELPTPDISLEDLQRTSQALLACGADIAQINAVRKHLSQVKGGQLLRAAAPARSVTLVISDVIGDPPEAISSGPTSPDPTTFAQVWEIVEKFGLKAKLPAPVLRHLRDGLEGQVPDTPKPRDPLFDRTALRIIGNNRILLEHAALAADQLGYRPLIVTDRMRGEAREQGARLAALVKVMLEIADKPVCLLAGGETTVTLTGSGKGGRNQELALAAAPGLEGLEDCLLLAAGSDGTDGPTDAAGALADGSTVARGMGLGKEARDYLERHDSYPYFRALGDLVVTGPTRTNVMDLIIALCAPSRE